jgi:hypothetical protein
MTWSLKNGMILTKTKLQGNVDEFSTVKLNKEDPAQLTLRHAPTRT